MQDRDNFMIASMFNCMAMSIFFLSSQCFIRLFATKHNYNVGLNFISLLAYHYFRQVKNEYKWKEEVMFAQSENKF